MPTDMVGRGGFFKYFETIWIVYEFVVGLFWIRLNHFLVFGNFCNRITKNS